MNNDKHNQGVVFDEFLNTLGDFRVINGEIAPLEPVPPFRLEWFANRQRAATFTLDIEVDWSDKPFLAVEFVVGIGFQAGFYLWWQRQ